MPRIVRFHETGGPEVMRIEELPSRDPGEGELRIRVRALGLNRAEAMYRSGMYLEQPRFPGGLGYEAAGLVDAVGPGVSGFEPGQAVSTIPAFSMNDYPMYGEVVVAPVHAVVAHPPEIGFADAAAVWMQYLTAWGALVDIAKVGPGDVVLVPAATSSVGLAAIQLCHAAGARPVALTRSRAKADALARAVPDTEMVFTDEQDIAAEVMRLTGGKGARVAFDPVGGPTVSRLADALAPGGILLEYGALSPEPTPFPLFAALAKGLTMRGYTLFEVTRDPVRLDAGKRFVLDRLAAGLRPVIARSFPFDQIVEAHRFLESNAQVGKIVVEVAAPAGRRQSAPEPEKPLATTAVRGAAPSSSGPGLPWRQGTPIGRRSSRKRGASRRMVAGWPIMSADRQDRCFLGAWRGKMLRPRHQPEARNVRHRAARHRRPGVLPSRALLERRGRRTVRPVPPASGRRRPVARAAGAAGVPRRGDGSLLPVLGPCPHACAARDPAGCGVPQAPAQRPGRQRPRHLADAARHASPRRLRHTHRAVLRDHDAPCLRSRLGRRLRDGRDAHLRDDRHVTPAEIKARTELVLANRFARIASVEEALSGPVPAAAA